MDLSKIKSLLWLNVIRYRIIRSLAAGAAPLLVHQMGKVGSTSLCQSLRSIAGLPPVLQTHFLTEKGIAGAFATLENWDSPPPGHLSIAKMICPLLKKQRYNNLMWHVATMVRDPVARQISDIYQNPEVVGEEAHGIPNPEIVLDYLNAYFRNFDESTDYVCQWFQTEFIDLFGLQVYERRFSEEKRYDIFEGNNVRALVFRLEDFSDVGRKALGEWLQVPITFQAQALNTSRDRDSFSSYKTVKENLKIQRSDLERVYSTKFSRHFYCDMQQLLIERWVG